MSKVVGMTTTTPTIKVQSRNYTVRPADGDLGLFNSRGEFSGLVFTPSTRPELGPTVLGAPSAWNARTTRQAALAAVAAVQS